ncbi:MAG: DegT/DnrJ/EryC1/StrS family aminotransferase [Planctomycetales bacterium]
MSKNLPSGGAPKTVLFAEEPTPLIDVRKQNDALQEEIQQAIREVCEGGQFVLGPAVQEFEETAAKYCDADHAIGCGSGSDALLLSLLALDVGRGDEVIMPSYTFFATAGAVWHAGATPIFAEIDPVTFNIDPEDLERKITPRTKAVIPVHLFGQTAEMEPIWRLAVKHRFAVVEDAAQAIGAEYRGRRTGVLGDIACFSFYPTKNLGAFGDGGMAVCNDPRLAEKLRLLRVHGMKPRYHHKIVGLNSRLSSIQAAVLSVKMRRLEEWTSKRIENAARYDSLFREYGLDQIVTIPTSSPDRRHAWNQYVIRVPDGKRDALRAHLGDHSIGSEIYYPIPVHQQECFQNHAFAQVDLPETDRAALDSLALPIFPELTPLQQWRVAHTMWEFFQERISRHPAESLKPPKFAGSHSRKPTNS